MILDLTHCDLPQDLEEGLRAFLADYRPRLTEAEAVQLILRLWLTDQGFVPVEPSLATPRGRGRFEVAPAGQLPADPELGEALPREPETPVIDNEDVDGGRAGMATGEAPGGPEPMRPRRVA
ncbi:hypothetical protein BN1110_04825 [bacterium YEK0313]|nr:hypothetical protein BN1110_04825 [bacterium YEK0313]